MVHVFIERGKIKWIEMPLQFLQEGTQRYNMKCLCLHFSDIVRTCSEMDILFSFNTVNYLLMTYIVHRNKPHCTTQGCMHSHSLMHVLLLQRQGVDVPDRADSRKADAFMSFREC